MTDTSDRAAGGMPAEADAPTIPGEPPADATEPAGGPSMFSLEGRPAPALYLIGWVASVMGLAVIFVSLMAAGGGAAPWLFVAGLLVLTLGVVSASGSQAVERARRPELAYRGPSPVLVFIVVLVLTLIAVLGVLAPLSALGLDPRSPVATTLSLAATTVVYVGALRLLVVGPGALSWRDMGLHGTLPEAARELAVGGMLAVPVLGVTLVLGGLLARFLQPEPSPLPESVDGLALVANLVSAAILAPIGEELFFRGFATTAWSRVVGAGPAIVRGAVFFAFAHILGGSLADESFAVGAQQALFSFLALLPVALTLGWVFLARRSLYAAIGLHATFNALQVLALFAAGQVV